MAKKPKKPAAKSRAYPPALKQLYGDYRNGVFEDLRLPEELAATFGDHAPIFHASATMQLGPDEEDETDLWKALVEADVLEQSEVGAHRKRYIPICLTDDAGREPHFNALVVDVTKDELPVFLIGETTDCRFVEVAPSLAKFRAQLAPPPKQLTWEQKDAEYIKQLHALCFDKHDYAAARELADEGTIDDDRRYEALRVWAFASLELGKLDKAESTYRLLHEEYGLLPDTPIVSACADLGKSEKPLAKKILTWLGIVPVVSEAEVAARRSWWQALEPRLKAALVEALSGKPPAIDDATDAHLMAIFAGSSLVVEGKQKPAIDLSPLARLPALVSLTLRGSAFVFDTLAPLTGLEKLRIEDPGAVKSVAFLAGMRRLRSLSMFDAEQVTDLSPLADAPALEFLQANDSPVRDLAFLRGKPALELLDLNVADKVTDFSPLGELRALTKLTLYSNTITTLDFLAPLSQLETVEVRPRRILRDKLALRDLDGLGAKPALRQLEIHDAPKLKDISVLRDAKALAQLTLADCVAVSDFSALAGCPLSGLELGGCERLADLCFLANKPTLTKLDIHKTRVTDLSPLAGCRALERLTCWGMKARPVIGLEHVLELPEIDNLSVQDDDLPPATGKLLRKRYRHLLAKD